MNTQMRYLFLISMHSSQIQIIAMKNREIKKKNLVKLAHTQKNMTDSIISK